MGPLKLLRHVDVILLLFFFYQKDKAKLCFLQQDFLIYKKNLEHELNELKCMRSCSFYCNFNIKTSKPSMTEQVFFFFFLFNGYCA